MPHRFPQNEHGDLARAEPRTLRYRVLHVAARRLWLRLPTDWPWANDIYTLTSASLS